MASRFSLKKLSIFICCVVFSVQTVVPMEKLLNGFQKNSKQLFNNIKKNNRAFSKIARSSFGTLRFNAAKNWKKYATFSVLAGVAGYGFYSVVDDVVHEQQEKSNAELIKKEKERLCAPYVEDYQQRLTEKQFKQASDFEKDIMIHAALECIRQGKEVKDFCLFEFDCTAEQKRILFTEYADLLKQQSELSLFMTYLTVKMYRHSKGELRMLLLEGIVATLEHVEKIPHFYIDQIYFNSLSDTQDLKVLDKALARRLKLDHAMYAGTQTAGHLSQNMGLFYNAIFNFVERKHSESLESVHFVIERALMSEQNYAQKNYDVLYHGQTLEHYWLELLYTELWQAKYSRSLNNYYFTRFMKDTTCQENVVRIQNGKELRKKLMLEGGYEDYDDKAAFNDGLSLMFTNYALFANSKYLGKSSFWYFLIKFNQKKIPLTNQDIFAFFGQEAFYLQHKKAIDELQQAFMGLSQHGNLMQIAAPQGYFKKRAYVACHDGSKINAYGKGDSDKVEKLDVSTLFDLIKTNPQRIMNSDQIEFVLIVTPDVVQQAPYKGVEINAFNTIDPEEFAAVMSRLRTTISPLVSKERILTPFECYTKYAN